MTIHQIECFLETAATRNFTEAANHLYISQQGLSRQIAALERELGMKLFYRTTRDVKLTRSGELLMWRWRDIPKEIRDSVELAREEGGQTKRRIRVSVVEMNGILELATGLMADYMACDGQTEFEVNQCSKFQDFVSTSPDVLITVSILPGFEQFKDRCNFLSLKELPMYYVMSKDHRLASREILEAADFRGETVLGLYRDFFKGMEMQMFDMFFGKDHGLGKVRFFENVQSMELALLAKGGISIGFKEMYHDFGDRLTMIPIPNKENQVSAKVVALWGKENEVKLKHFIKFLKTKDN